jgi:RNA polymerase sigma-70 factor (ECF subfamily)
MRPNSAIRPEPQAQTPVSGDSHASTFAQIYESCFAFVWRTAFRLGTPEANLDDVVQDVFVVVFRRQAEFEGRSSIKTWLFGIVFNVVRTHRRQLGSKHPAALHADLRADPDLLVDRNDGPQEQAAKREAARFVDQFLEQLNEDQRDVFILAELEQLSAPEIATVLEVGLNTVYSRLRLARAEFTKAVARYRARDRRQQP